MTRVSVIIPNYNHAAYLEKRIENVLNQAFGDFELILMDDCSTDNSRDIIERYRSHPKVAAILYNESNSGSTFKQWNKGVSKARGENIWIAESDDLAAENFLEELVAILDAQPNVGLVYAKSVTINEEDKIMDDLGWWYESLDKKRWSGDYYNNGKEELSNYLIYKNTIPNASGVLFRKRIFLSMGMAPEEYRFCGDWITWMRFLHISDISYTVKVTNFFRRHNNNVRRSKNILLTEVKERYAMIRDLKKHDIISKRESAIMTAEINQMIRVNSSSLWKNGIGKMKSSLLDALLLGKLWISKIVRR